MAVARFFTTEYKISGRVVTVSCVGIGVSLNRTCTWAEHHLGHRDDVSRLGTIVTRWKTKTWAQNREYIRRSTELSWPVLLAGVVCLSSGINNYLVLCSFDPAAVFGNIFICSGGERTLPSLIWRYLSGLPTVPT